MFNFVGINSKSAFPICEIAIHDCAHVVAVTIHDSKFVFRFCNKRCLSFNSKWSKMLIISFSNQNSTDTDELNSQFRATSYCLIQYLMPYYGLITLNKNVISVSWPLCKTKFAYEIIQCNVRNTSVITLLKGYHNSYDVNTWWEMFTIILPSSKIWGMQWANKPLILSVYSAINGPILFSTTRLMNQMPR